MSRHEVMSLPHGLSRISVYTLTKGQVTQTVTTKSTEWVQKASKARDYIQEATSTRQNKKHDEVYGIENA